jgi:3-hydroxymyristoyl/3-hydroxydecanoyl-(acyl carrier protein) dehydratase
MHLKSRLEIAADHAAFAGHFPTFPILPGAALLDEALAAIASTRGIDLTQWRIASAKFHEAVRPGDELSLEHDAAANGALRFTIRSAKRLVASGTLVQALPEAIAVPAANSVPADGTAWRSKS